MNLKNILLKQNNEHFGFLIILDYGKQKYATNSELLLILQVKSYSTALVPDD